MAPLSFSRYLLRNAADLRSAIGLLRLARHRKPPTGAAPVSYTIRFLGRHVRLFLRPSTTDISVVRECFAQRSYEIPELDRPATIVDIGANVGLVSMYYALRYPESRIYAFEPVKANADLARTHFEANGIRNVSLFTYGLGDRETTLPIYQSSPGNFGGCTTTAIAGTQPVETVRIRDTLSTLDELGLDRVDLFKVDCEGGEVGVFHSLGERIARCGWLIGELHSEWIDVPAMIAHIEKTHAFQIDNPGGGSCVVFRARRRA